MARNDLALPLWDLRSWVLCVGLALGSATALMAQPAPDAADEDPATQSAQQNVQHIFQRNDTNGDGALSREEAQSLPAVLQQFDLWDHDGDGQISLEEFLRSAGATSTR